MVDSDLLTGVHSLPKEDLNLPAGKERSDVCQIQPSLSTGPADKPCSQLPWTYVSQQDEERKWDKERVRLVSKGWRMAWENTVKGE